MFDEEFIYNANGEDTSLYWNFLLELEYWNCFDNRASIAVRDWVSAIGSPLNSRQRLLWEKTGEDTSFYGLISSPSSSSIPPPCVCSAQMSPRSISLILFHPFSHQTDASLVNLVSVASVSASPQQRGVTLVNPRVAALTALTLLRQVITVLRQVLTLLRQVLKTFHLLMYMVLICRN